MSKPECKGKKTDGTKCRKTVSEASNFCEEHKKLLGAPPPAPEPTPVVAGIPVPPAEPVAEPKPPPAPTPSPAPPVGVSAPEPMAAPPPPPPEPVPAPTMPLSSEAPKTGAKPTLGARSKSFADQLLGYGVNFLGFVFMGLLVFYAGGWYLGRPVAPTETVGEPAKASEFERPDNARLVKLEENVEEVKRNMGGFLPMVESLGLRVKSLENRPTSTPPENFWGNPDTIRVELDEIRRIGEDIRNGPDPSPGSSPVGSAEQL